MALQQRLSHPDRHRFHHQMTTGHRWKVLVAERVQVFEQELVVGQVRVLEQVAEVQRLQILEVKEELEVQRLSVQEQVQYFQRQPQPLRLLENL